MKLEELVTLTCDICKDKLTAGEIKYNAHPARRETKTLCYQCSKSLLAKAKNKARTLTI